MFEYEHLLDRYVKLLAIRDSLMIHPDDSKRSINTEIKEVENYYKNIL